MQCAETHMPQLMCISSFLLLRVSSPLQIVMFFLRASLFSFTSLKQKQTMAKITLILFFSLFIFCTPFCVGGVYSNGQKSLKVSPSEFLTSLRLVDKLLQDVTAIVQDIDNSRFPRAPISTCLELLHMSAEELSWCVSAVENPQGKNM